MRDKDSTSELHSSARRFHEGGLFSSGFIMNVIFQDDSDEPMETTNQHLPEVYDGQLTLILSLFYPCSCSVPLWDLQGLSTYCLKPLQTSFLSQNSVQMYAVTHSSLCGPQPTHNSLCGSLC